MGQLIAPTDRLGDTFPDLGFRDNFKLVTTGEPLVVCDPIAIADVFNDTDSLARFLRDRGVFFADLGGGTSGPILWRDPHLVLCVATNADSEISDGSAAISEEVRTDSGCFMFLALSDDTPVDVRARVNAMCSEGDGATIDVPAGEWSFFYEQLSPPEGSPAEFYRNVVARRSAAV